MIPEPHAVQTVGAGLGGQSNGCSACHALLGIERTGTDVHRVDGFHRLNIGGVMRQPNVDVHRAVGERSVVVRIGSVDKGAQGAARRIHHSVLRGRRSGSGNQIQECLVVAVSGQRNVGHRARCDLCTHIALVRLEGAGFSRDGHLIGNLSDLHADVHTSDVVDGNVNARARESTKTSVNNFDVIPARRQADSGITALIVRLHFTKSARGFVRDGDVGVRNHSSGGIFHLAYKGAVQDLSIGRGYRQGNPGQDR